MNISIKRLFLICLLLLTSSAWARDLQEAYTAYHKKDYATALLIFKSAAEQGYPNAQVWLGDMYLKGEGVPRNYTQALRWFRLAAEKGYDHAQLRLGNLYTSGEGVAQNYTEANRWYKLAAEQGLDTAQLSLGFAYIRGLGVTPDLVKAHMWWNLAASQGGADELSKLLRDDIAKQMSPQQIAKAQELASKCQASNYKNCD
jgi:hypothetical protein